MKGFFQFTYIFYLATCLNINAQDQHIPIKSQQKYEQFAQKLEEITHQGDNAIIE